MKTFFLFLCLILLWTGGSIVAQSNGVVKFEFSQQPEVVEVGGEVKVVCKATAAKENKLHYFSWTDGGGVDILTTSTNPEGEYVLTVNESKLDESKVVFCTVSVEVDKKQKQENGSYTVHVAEESHGSQLDLNGVVKFEFSQQPEVVEVGGEVKVVCKATAAEENKLHYFSWTDGGGVDILTTSTNPEGEYVLTVNESELDESKVVYCTVSVEVDKKQKQENGSYTVHVADVKVLIPPETVFVEPNENAIMTCAIKGSYVPLKNPWSDPKGELKGLDIKISRIPPATTSGVIVWIVQFNNVSNQLDTKYTFHVPGIEPLEVYILRKNPTEESHDSQMDLNGLHQLVNVSYLSVISGNKSIEVGSTVNVSCIVNFSSIAKLKPVGDYPLWLDNSTETPLTENDGGVVAIFEMKENNNSASRMLQLRASVINGTKWPKPLKCADKVKLPDGDELISYSKTFSVNFTIPLKVITVPPSGETVNVAVGAKYWISCVVTGDEAPPDNPWLHSDKTVEDDTKAGVTVTTVSLQDTIGIKSTITFTKVTKDQLGDYICSAGDGKPNVTVTLEEAVPLKVTTVPPSGETVKVAVGAKYWISCVVTGDETPATNQWLHSDKMVETDTDAGITVSNITLPNSKRINSTITFTHVTEDQLGVYICSAGDGKPNATVTLKKADISDDQVKATESTPTPTPSPGQGSVGIAAVAVAIVVVLVLVGVVIMVYWKRHVLRDWLMDKDVVKVMKKGKRGKGYKYSKLPKDISTSMKHLE